MSEETGREPTRSELTLIRQALRQDWPVPPAVKGQILQRLIDYLDREHLEGATASDRLVIAAAKTFVEFMKLSIDQQRLDLLARKLDAGHSEPDEARDDIATLRDYLDVYQQPGPDTKSGPDPKRDPARQ